MKKITILFFCVIGFYTLSAQDLEEKIFQETCNCLDTQIKVDFENFTECLSRAISLNAQDTLKINAILKDKEEVSKRLTKWLDENCLSFGKVKYWQKEERFYKNSKNEVALEAYAKGKGLMDIKEYKKAIPLFTKAIKKDKKFVKAYDELATCNRNLEKYDEALTYFMKSLEIFPEGKHALLNLAGIYSIIKNYDKSLEYYEKLKTIHPYDAEGYYGESRVYFIKKEYEKALEDAFICHKIYVTTNSPYQEDSKKLVSTLYQELKKQNKEDLFKKLAEKYNINIAIKN